MRWAGALYRASLVLLPASLVRKHGGTMEALFLREVERVRRERGAWAVPAAVAAGLFDVIRCAVAIRLRLPIGEPTSETPTKTTTTRTTTTTGGHFMDEMRRNLWYALRSLTRAPRFTLAVVLMLGLGIGANTAIFSVVDAVMLRPLPFPQPERVVHLAWVRQGGLVPYMPHFKVAFWREHAESLDALTTFTTFTTVPKALGDERNASPLRALAIDHEFFEAVGVRPSLGRDFDDGEQRPEAAPVAILSHHVWTDHFAADRGILGTNIRLDGEPTTVVGVLPEGFRLPYESSDVDLVVPLARRPDPQNEAEGFPALGRLAPGATVAQAEADIERVWERFQAEHANIVNGTDGGMRVASFQTLFAGDLGRTLWVLFAAIGLVLAIACANVANLLLARASSRERDVAVRAALGASRGRIVREVLTESTLLALAGAALGLVFAVVGIDMLLALNPEPLPRAQEIGLDGRVLGFTLVAALVTGLLFGLPAALPAARASVAGTLREATRGGTRRTGRQMLLAAEAALSMVLLVGAGLLVTTLLELRSVDAGFDASDVLAFQLADVPDEYRGGAPLLGLEERTLAALADQPAISAAAWASNLPLERGMNIPVSPEARPDDVVGATEWRAVTPGYVDALDLTLIRGRDLDATDASRAEPVALLNETAARHFFPEGALGERIEIGKYRGRFIDPSFEAPPSTVVGVVADQRDISLRSPARSTVFVARAQVPEAMLGRGQLVVESDRPGDALDAVRTAIAAAAPGVTLPDVRPLDRVVASSLARERFYATLMLVFAGVALTLTAFGIYGVVDYAARQRRREIGIRIALGAARARVTRQMTVQGLRPVLLGLIAGAAGALYLARYLAHLLWGVSPTDPMTIAAVGVLLLAAAGLASWLPARGATRDDPVHVLQAE